MRKRSDSSRSINRSRGRAPPRSPVDIYLFPAVIGGGRGDVEDVLNVGRSIARDGQRIELFRLPGRALPRGVDRSFEWPPIARRRRPTGTFPHAVTITPAWGITAAAGRDEPFGRPGPWAPECRAIEQAYGPDRVLHVSLEEFARTYPSREQERARFREAGRTDRWVRGYLQSAQGRRAVIEMHAAYRRFRAFDTPHVAHLFPTFFPDRRFAREFPEAIQCGPIPRHPAPPRWVERPRRVPAWLWYASPGTSARLVPALANALARRDPPRQLWIRGSPSEFRTAMLPANCRWISERRPSSWRKVQAVAELSVITGSRSLIEELQRGRPFLYFNGVLGNGRSVRPHRPEKLESLCRAWRSEPRSTQYARDLRDFARLRRVPPLVERAAGDYRWRRGFPTGVPAGPFAPGFGHGDLLLRRMIREFPRFAGTSAEYVRTLRRAAALPRPARRSNP